MTAIKICGITNLADAKAALDQGVDALGFIFYEKSPRYIAPEAAAAIIRKLPPAIAKVGVFVNHDTQAVKDIFSFCGLTFIQLHGHESPEYCRAFSPQRLIKALALRKAKDIEDLALFPVRVILADTHDPRQFGGTGRTSNWELAALAARQHPLILSGGLKAENIQEAIAQVAPAAVDINSGVESAPGRKDPARIKEITALIRALQQNTEAPEIFRTPED